MFIIVYYSHVHLKQRWRDTLQSPFISKHLYQKLSQEMELKQRHLKTKLINAQEQTCFSIYLNITEI